MEDIADLGLAVHSDSVPVATERLNRMKVAASQVDLVVGKLIGTVGKLVAAYATWQIAEAVVRKYVAATVEAERVQTQLTAALKSTGGVAGQTITALNAHADALKKLTAFDDEAINGAQALLLTFTKIRGDTFPKATEAVLDLATAMHTDLNSAAIQVGKALNDPILGMTALTRSGIQFTAQQKAMVKQLVESNNIIGAQKIILKELENQFGGSARAARGTLGGALSALGNAFDDLFEATGPAADHLRDAVEGLIKGITDPNFIMAVQNLGASLFEAFSAVLPAIQQIAEFLSSLGQSGGVTNKLLGKSDAQLLSDLKWSRDKIIAGTDGFGGRTMSQHDLDWNTQQIEAIRSELAARKRRGPMDDIGSGPGGFGSFLAGTVGFGGRSKAASAGLSTDQISTMEKAAKDYAKLTLSAQQFIDQQQLQAETLGKTAEETSRLTHEQDLLNKAANDNINLTPDQRREIEGLAASMAAAEEQTRRLTEVYDLGRSALNGFFSDLKGNLQAGQDLWTSFGNAAGGVLDTLANKALSMAADGIWNAIFGAIGGGLTGGIGSAFSGGWGSAAFPKFASGTNFAPGGLAIVGERGPELVNLPRGSQVIPNGANQNMPPIVINNAIDARGATADAAPAIARQVTASLRQQLPDAIARYQANPLRRAG